MRISNRGFALLELIVVLVIMGILLSIAALNFHSWQIKHGIEGQAKEMLTDLSDLRGRAIQTKSNHVAVLSAEPDLLTIRRYADDEAVTLTSGTEIFRKRLKYPVSRLKADGTTDVSGDIGINSRGYTNDFIVGGSFISNQTLVILPLNTEAAYDCLVISQTRINLGKVNGTNCIFK